MNTDALNLKVGINAKPLRSTLRRLAAGIAVLTLASPLLAWADCVDARKFTAAETDFYNRAWAALVAALPPMPVGARVGQGGQDSFQRLPPMPHLCPDEKIGAFQFDVRRTYEIFHAKPYQAATVRVMMNVRQLPAPPGRDPSAAYGTASPGRSEGLKVHNIVWSISGGNDSPLGKAVSGGFDRARLEAMVGKPLPSVAESKAYAAQAVPATVATAPVAAPAPAAAQASTTQSVAAQPAAPGAPAQPAASDSTRDAVDTVNRLRGLFGR